MPFLLCSSTFIKAPLLSNKIPTGLASKGYYNADASNLNFRRLLLKSEEKPKIVLTPKEAQFLPYVCRELTYKQIADQMKLSERTIDGYREALFIKFHVQSRVGLCLEAIRKGFIHL